MLEHKQPGKATRSAGAAHEQDHGPGPGKQTRVAREGAGAIASAASIPLDGGGPAVTTSASKTASFHEGNVLISETVGVSLTHGKGPVTLDVSHGTLQIGDDHLTTDFKLPGAATGSGFHLTGAATTITKNSSQRTAARINREGYVGVDYTTSWTVKSKAWTATIAVTAFIGTKPPKPHHHFWDPVVHAITHAVKAAAHAVAEVSEAIVGSAPKWGPYLVAALAALATAGEAAATG